MMVSLVRVTAVVIAGMLAAISPAAPFEIASELRVRDGAAAERTRAEVMHYIWKGGRLPRRAAQPVAAEAAPLILSLHTSNLAHVTTLKNDMARGVSTWSHLLRADRFEGCLVTYHFGHNEGPAQSGAEDLISRVLDGGCDVLVLTMPLMHGNPKPVVPTELGAVRLTNHNAFLLLDGPTFSPIRYFLEPVALGLAYAEEQRGHYRLVAMVGLSGGGWTTTLYAAIDPRVHASYQVAGTLPLSLRGERQFGDWEQMVPALYRLASYLDLYALATHPRRRHVQMLNVHDPCCFSGQAARVYEDAVAGVASSFGGSFAISFDHETAVHAVSRKHIDTILRDITAIGGPTFPGDGCADRARLRILAGPFTSNTGHAFTAAVAGAGPSHSMANPAASRLVLCEDGRALGPPHTTHDTIRRHGRGAFSHWEGTLYFSSSDNTDPNSNGRSYAFTSRGPVARRP
jgi:hypothetical protein